MASWRKWTIVRPLEVTSRTISASSSLGASSWLGRASPMGGEGLRPLELGVGGLFKKAICFVWTPSLASWTCGCDTRWHRLDSLRSGCRP